MRTATCPQWLLGKNENDLWSHEFQCATVCGIHHGRVKRKWIVEA